MSAGALAALDRWAVRPFARTIDAWFASTPTGRAVAILLALFVAAWTTFHVASTASIDLHPDQIEVFAWSRHLQAGYAKHPPLGAFVTAAWFSIFPATDWAFRLLAMVNAALALFCVDLIARRYVSGERRLLVLLLLLLTPFYQFLSERIGANQMLFATWPLATYCFLRAFETRAWQWAIAAGAAAALAMLGKYWSVYLIAGFAAAVFAHPARWTYLRSPSPWISAAAGFTVLAPHLRWLAMNGFQPFGYALHAHSTSMPAGVVTALEYLMGSAAYLALAAAVYTLAVRPTREHLREALWPADPDRRMLAALLAAYILLPALTAPLAGVRITSLWSAQAWFLLPILVLAAPGVEFSSAAARRTAVLAAAVAIVSLAASPLIALYFLRRDPPDGRAHYAAVSRQITHEWHRLVGRPLPIVLGDYNIAAAPTFYSPDHPDSVQAGGFEMSPWVTRDRLHDEGWAGVCRSEDAECRRFLAQLSADDPRATQIEFETSRSFLGLSTATIRFVILVVPPRSVAASTDCGRGWAKA